MFPFHALAGWLVAGSVVLLIVSLIAVPAVVIRLPADYFSHRRRRSAKPVGDALLLYYVWLITKNVIGVLLVTAGLAMLVLPGQGILSILLGLTMVDFAGKYHLERFIVTRSVVLKSLNWIRCRAGKPPFQVEETDEPWDCGRAAKREDIATERPHRPEPRTVVETDTMARAKSEEAGWGADEKRERKNAGGRSV